MRERYGLSARQVFTELPEWELEVLLEAAVEDAQRHIKHQRVAPRGFHAFTGGSN